MKNRTIQHLRLNATDFHAELTELDTESDPAQGNNLGMTLTVFLFATGRRKARKRPIFLVSQVGPNKRFLYITRSANMTEQQHFINPDIHCLTADSWPANDSQVVCTVQEGYREKPL